ncbi:MULTISPECIES: ogr/Delta-like zinc finger family protein [Pseudomonas]|uniref:ogr/Delta-like zinc finger family protein n=1 Tax=Pseudomonas TaxID=286 RepID=UPI0005A86C20|nr:MULTISPECIES: ogr/Delta-like zinc finger family protein [Pseudomonas]AZD95310.1 putative phage protein [Pseudomonas chlororaphis subsp. aureofaciens]KAB0523085.1 ogr/Delta-like zinc finger family protein [Pseudomonas chlororaphis subsp. aureofaciens]NBF12901.1 transcriptional regulator [Pseudomonas sp. Fl4BN1]TSD29359.1 ogr/Delta-like zinc finger family protein [Pseudomonas sp. ATCC 13985]WDG47821.1 ogr/Delta-like zinc finger family protein [Pseudomonas chlororaphis]
MRVYCKECQSKGRIVSREDLSKEFAKLYCQCTNATTCGHTWVANLTFSHTLSPSAQAVDRLLFDRLREMPRAQQRELFEQLAVFPSV